ncbi:hypothetical protein MRB53_013499 [Persea americana]|uniref:Uncharacterized protein n=1 Tax=Persea americana TaxID=3435 RepID=A0ACC2K8F9_PERAE|nr:hypothetical protein MRB53_013499 [Persea americana]
MKLNTFHQESQTRESSKLNSIALMKLDQHQSQFVVPLHQKDIIKISEIVYLLGQIISGIKYGLYLFTIQRRLS